MPSAHGHMFRRIQIQENIGMNLRFLSDCLIAHDPIYFLSQTKIRPTLRIFLSECHLAHAVRFLLELLRCDQCRRGPNVALRESNFYRTGVGLHTIRSLSQTNSEIRGPTFYRTKNGAHDPIFGLQYKKIGPYALGVSWLPSYKDRCLHTKIQLSGHVLDKPTSETRKGTRNYLQCIGSCEAIDVNEQILK